jgi:small subunit ribosomal protein S1
MANEVINETEDSKANETPAIEDTNNETSVETPSETSAAVEAKTETAAPVSQTEETIDEQQNSNEIDFGAILEKFEQDQIIYHSGELVEGKVIGVSDRGVLIDFGYKSEGAVPLEEFTTPDGEVEVKEGDQVEVVIRSIHTGDAPPILSRYDAVRRKSWDAIEKAYNDETTVTGRVIDKTKGGLRIDLNGVEAFLPGSQIDSRPIRHLDAYIGQDIESRVIKFSRKRNNIVLSRKVITDEVVNKQKAETLGQIEEGYIVEGTVKNLTEYGAFVDIGGIDGLLHVTDMSWGRQNMPGDFFRPGENVQVKVLKLDRQREKISLGYKQLIPDPWQTVPEIYPVGARVKGKISSVTDYGAFVELEPGIEGLIHVSEMSWSKRSKSPRKMMRAGEEVEVQVLGIDTSDHRISLGLKQLQPNPWETVKERYHVGDRIHGKVRNITEFGAFVEVEEGIDGLVHVSDITWSKKIRHPKELLERDQEVDAIITSIDPAGRRMSLSMKDIAPSEWEAFVATHKPGDTVHGKISRFAGFGVFVELGNELEGLCHISELSDERIDKPEDVVQIGQEMDFKILRIEHEDQKIGLSARAVSRDADSSVDSRSYSTEAKGGMASLGELANLKFGRTTSEEETKDEPKLSKKERKALKAQERVAAEASTAEETDSSSQENEAPEEAVGETSEPETVTAETSEDSASPDTTETAAQSEIEEAQTETVESSETDSTSSVDTTDAAQSETETPSQTDVEAESAPETADETTVAEAADTAETAVEAGDETEGKTANS